MRVAALQRCGKLESVAFVPSSLMHCDVVAVLSFGSRRCRWSLLSAGVLDVALCSLVRCLLLLVVCLCVCVCVMKAVNRSPLSTDRTVIMFRDGCVVIRRTTNSSGSLCDGNRSVNVFGWQLIGICLGLGKAVSCEHSNLIPVCDAILTMRHKSERGSPWTHL